MIRADGTFELRKTHGWGCDRLPGAVGDPGAVERHPGAARDHIYPDFEAFDLIGPFSCGEGFASFFFDTHVALAYCGVLLQAGLEEGFDPSVPRSDPGFPHPSPESSPSSATARSIG